MYKFLSRSFRSNTAARIVYALIVMILMVGASGPYANQPVNNLIITDTWAVQVLPATDPELLASQLGAENLGAVGTLTDTYLFRMPGSDTNSKAATDVFSADAQILWFEQQTASQQGNVPFVPPTDPLYSSQWHLENTDIGGVDINVVPAWTDGYTGKNVTIAIVDDGVQYNHSDLTAQYKSLQSWDFIENDNIPLPIVSQDIHGTVAAGLAAANNDTTCGVGVAYDANLAVLRTHTDTALRDTMEAAALNYALNTNSIYSNSWGPLDDGLHLQEPGPLTLAALQNGVTNGRDGKGSIYVWAAGNGRQNLDNVNYDGYANSRFTIAVGAVDDTGVQSNYSEPGAAILVSAPSGGNLSRGIATTDLMGADGFNAAGDCVTDFGSTADASQRGTSASAPIVSGVVALMLEANPLLGWRDVQYILAQTAVETGGEPYTINGAGFHVNHKYGFGLVNAGAAVALAKTWKNVGTLDTLSSGIIPVNQPIPDNEPTGLTSNYVVNQNIKLEHVEVVFTTTGHAYRGDLEILLTSPSGTQSILATGHNDETDDYSVWKFMTVRNWGESSNGTWSLKVIDTAGTDYGNLTSWQLNLYGTVPAGTNNDIGVPDIMAGIPYQSTIDTIEATTAVDDPTVPACGLNQGSNSVWYSYTPTISKPVYFDTYGSSYDTFIAVWSGSRGALTPITCNNNSASTAQSAVGFSAAAFTTYYIEVAQYNGPLSATSAAPIESPPNVSASTGGILRFHGTSFSDVRGNYWAWKYIEGLYAAGVTSGCGLGTYCPATVVTRAQMAIFLLRGIHGSTYVPPEATGTVFNDVPVDSFGAAFIEQLKLENITSGCTLTTYCPNTPVTRAQMAIFLLRAEHGSTYTPPPATGTRFTDVPLGSFGAAFIEQLASEGVTSGCTPSTYCPSTPVTRAQMAVFLDRTFGLLPLP